MHNLWLDVKYSNLLSSNLLQFKLKNTNPYLANCRCPICGDSSRNKFKARGYIYENKGRLIFKCHNCGISTNFDNLIKSVNSPLYNEYIVEKLKLNTSDIKPIQYQPDITRITKRRIDKFNPFKDIKKISQLKDTHPAKKYIMDREIPSKQHYRMYFVPEYNSWVNKIIPNKLDDKTLSNDEPRLVLPFIDQYGYVYGFTGRSFKKKSSLRYMTIMLDDTKQKMFGLENVDIDKKIYIVEGPIDSLFLDNAIAMAGSDIKYNFNKFVVIYDNEPRNEQIVKKIESCIDRGYDVCIWPNSIQQKDINDMVLNGIDNIQYIIDNNIFNGLHAKLRLNEWKKI